MIKERVLPPILRLIDGDIVLRWAAVDGQDKSWSLIFDPQSERNRKVIQYLSLYEVVFVGLSTNHPFKEGSVGTEEEYFCCLWSDCFSEIIFFFLDGDDIPEHYNNVSNIYFET